MKRARLRRTPALLRCCRPISFRPATKLEPTPDLQHPVFSNCTVPVVMWSPWPHNYVGGPQLAVHLFQSPMLAAVGMNKGANRC